MFHGHRHALIGVGLTLAGMAVGEAALAESRALAGPAARGLFAVAVAGYFTAGIGALQAIIEGRIGLYPLLLLSAPYALWSHLRLLPLRPWAGMVYHKGYKEGDEVVAWRLAHDRLVVVRLFESFPPETVEGVSIFHPASQRSRLCQMLESAGVPRVSEPLAELCETTREWTSAIRWNIEPDGDTGEVALNLAVDERNRLALAQLHHSMAGLWNSDDLSRDDILRLAVWQALATDAFYGYKDKGSLDRLLAWATW